MEKLKTFGPFYQAGIFFFGFFAILFALGHFWLEPVKDNQARLEKKIDRVESKLDQILSKKIARK